MRRLRDLLLHNWFLKLFSVTLAALLWVTLASESTSEIGIEAPIEYRNVPASSEITGDTATSVQVRLRGPASLIREIQSQDISSVIDLAKIDHGDKVVPLTPDDIQAPFGIEVVSVTPSRISLSVEKTITRVLPVVPVIVGEPAAGFRVVSSTVVPAVVQVQGPETRVNALDKIRTAMIDISDRNETVNLSVELDPEEPLIRIPQSGPVRVEIVITP